MGSKPKPPPPPTIVYAPAPPPPVVTQTPTQAVATQTALNEVSGNLSASGINLAFSGSVGDLIALSGIDLKLNSSGKDLSEIGPIIGQKLPTTDKFALKGQLTGSATILSFRQAQAKFMAIHWCTLSQSHIGVT